MTKRRVSGGIMNAGGCQARNITLGSMKICRKLCISFFAYLGDWLGLNRSEGHALVLPEIDAGEHV